MTQHEFPEASPLRSTLGVAAAWVKATSAIVFMGAVLHMQGCSSVPSAEVLATTAAAAKPGENWGIQVEALRLSAAGSMLDLRYRVIDKEKAAPLLDSKRRPYLVDEVRGAKFGVPDTPILGQLRQTSRNHTILAGHSYFVLFANPGKFLHSGDKVTLVMGDAKLPDLTIE
jgi:hypothetical protein